MLNSSWHLWGLFLSCFLMPWWKKILYAPVGFRTCFYSPNALGPGQPGGSWRCGNRHCSSWKGRESRQILPHMVWIWTRFSTWSKPVLGLSGQKNRPKENYKCVSKSQEQHVLLSVAEKLHSLPKAFATVVTHKTIRRGVCTDIRAETASDTYSKITTIL